MSKEYKKVSSTKDKYDGIWDNYHNGSQKVTVYSSKSGNTSIFIDGKKVNKNK